MQPEYQKNHKGSLRPKNMTVKEYSEFLGGISKRTIENWEYRGTTETTFHLLMKIQEQEEKIIYLENQLKHNQMIFKLEKGQ